MWVIAAEHQTALRIANGHEYPPQLRRDQIAAGQIGEHEDHYRGHVEPQLGRRLLQRKPEQTLKIGQAVVPAESRVVAEEQQHQRVGHGLGNDGEIDPSNPRAKGKKPKDIGQYSRDEERHPQGKPKVAEPIPVPREFLPIEKDHEVGQFAPIDPLRPNGPHQVHPHGIAAQRKEHAVSQAENAGISPDQIHGQGNQGIAHELAEQRDEIVREVERRVSGQKIQAGNDNHPKEEEQPDQAPLASGMKPQQRRQHGAGLLRLLRWPRRRVGHQRLWGGLRQ